MLMFFSLFLHILCIVWCVANLPRDDERKGYYNY